jgi:hypothetical protein
METVGQCFSETLVSTYKSTRRYNPEDQHLHRRENLKSHNTHNYISCVSIFSFPRQKINVAMREKSEVKKYGNDYKREILKKILKYQRKCLEHVERMFPARLP